ncbi:ATP-dependent DNA helicase DinG [Alkalibacillus haloalkaliphilus]|uniref:3'-5' exonuclease DinG n=1 Tax=Alkalibacillus haloalkaliphilus TaxID=94136 RepID=A0A511W2Y4_9BACI|nr:ATP-dependent DNA helicase DinG [Alkalibacillus haloalkaliphilus]GEN45131.1 putative ATP-dependent helicase DinG [Alkalibacillus haloalkaliphilus]
MDRYVVVDLETTGHSVKKGDEIIEIGIVVLEGHEIVEEYATKVKPTTEIPVFVSNLTGIHHEDLTDAPYFSEIIHDLIPMFNNSYFVAHQVQFDYEFLNASLVASGHEPLNCLTIDTVELSRILFPKSPGYKLSEITQYLGIEHVSPHRALSDAYVTALLWLEIKNKLQLLPFKTLENLIHFIPSLHSELEGWFNALIETKRHNYSQHHNLVEQHGLMVRHLVDQQEEQPLLPDHYEDFVEHVFENSLKQKRSGQKEIAQLIYDQMSVQENVVIEAGTGLGKTIGYLIPSLYNAAKQGKRTVVSTSTIQLQNQIIKEADLLSLKLKQPITISVLKSPKHYIDTKRFKTYLDHFNELDNYDAVLTLAMIIVWLTETKTGDIDELHLPSNGVNIWKYINCYHQNQRDGSFFYEALRQSEQASLVVVNHAFLLNSTLYGHGRIPKFNHAVIDEAHQFESVAREQFSKDLSYVTIVHLLQDLQKVVNHDVIDHARFYADAFFRSVYQSVEFLHGEDDLLTDTGKAQLTIGEEYLNLMLNGEVKEHLNQLFISINYILEELKNKKSLNKWQTIISKHAFTQLNEMMNTFKAFFDPSVNDVRWIEIDQYGAKNAATIHVEPVSVRHYLEQFYEKADNFIFTSATLKTGHSYKPFLERTGLPEKTNCQTFDSPFNYEQQAKVLIPNNIPDVSKTKVNHYTSYVADFIERYSTQVNGKMLVLFTSYDMLRIVFKHLKRMKSLDGNTIIGQGISTGSRDKLKKMFETEDQVVLLGTNSFWEGIDLVDANKSKTVCLVRLPFETPTHPFILAKTEELEMGNYNVFQHLALPIAIQRFRQAFGRIIRDEQDRGAFIILDQRVMKKGYGKQFLNSLPETTVIHDDLTSIITHAKKWLS